MARASAQDAKAASKPARRASATSTWLRAGDEAQAAVSCGKQLAGQLTRGGEIVDRQACAPFERAPRHQPRVRKRPCFQHVEQPAKIAQRRGQQDAIWGEIVEQRRRERRRLAPIAIGQELEHQVEARRAAGERAAGDHLAEVVRKRRTLGCGGFVAAAGEQCDRIAAPGAQRSSGAMGAITEFRHRLLDRFAHRSVHTRVAVDDARDRLE
jgi:hypothetical protein